jgi:hypothetical protein
MRQHRREPKDSGSSGGAMSSQVQRPVLNMVERYQIVRDQIEHEDNLISQRLSWLLASQAFLFTAYAITLNGPVQLHSLKYELHVGLMIMMLPLIGIFTALLIWIAILAGLVSMTRLRNDFSRGSGNALPEGVPAIQTSGWVLIAGQLGPVFIPVLFLSAWLMTLFKN